MIIHCQTLKQQKHIQTFPNYHPLLTFQDDYEFRRQFSCCMKTIAVIPVEPQGVVQFGSIDKILETMEFVNQTKSMFQEILNLGGSEVGLTSFDGQTCYQNEAFASLISPQESFFTDFGIPDEFFQNGNFPPLNPIDSDGKHESLTISGTDVDLLRNSGDLGHILAPFIDGSHSGFHSFSSECMSMSESAQRVDCTTLGPKERLFSKLGIEELLEGVSGISNADSMSCIDGQVSAKRRKTGNSKWEEVMPISQPGLRMVDGYSVSDSSTVMQAKRQVEQSKPIKKKAKPGTRPRPKDRQQILDRMAELRLLIHNGEKVSIHTY
ncbi:Myc-type, basic helix-loop-helix domain-containing protein [Tanacetum coccineum]|uniref:Myc-type, basic helix-loop-helix domain-containing protein n=1 Tax=Tanacetum coccineum TaxID=301880 RepID=A0ABQ4WP60_9ASTR